MWLCVETSITMDFSNMNDVLYGWWYKSQITYITERQKKTIYKDVRFTHVSKRDIHNFQYVQDLIIDTQNAVAHLDTKLLVTSAHYKIPQIRNSKFYEQFTLKKITYKKTNSQEANKK